MGEHRGMSISPEGYGPLLEIALAHPIRLIASALGPPPPDLIESAHDRDVTGWPRSLATACSPSVMRRRAQI